VEAKDLLLQDGERWLLLWGCLKVMGRRQWLPSDEAPKSRQQQGQQWRRKERREMHCFLFIIIIIIVVIVVVASL